MEPMVLKSVAFQAWGHSTGFQLAKKQSSNIIFMNANMEASFVLDWKVEECSNFFDEIHGRKQVFAGGAQSNVL